MGRNPLGSIQGAFPCFEETLGQRVLSTRFISKIGLNQKNERFSRGQPIRAKSQLKSGVARLH
jgi:hypothetical protein